MSLIWLSSLVPVDLCYNIVLPFSYECSKLLEEFLSEKLAYLCFQEGGVSAEISHLLASDKTTHWVLFCCCRIIKTLTGSFLWLSKHRDPGGFVFLVVEAS